MGTTTLRRPQLLFFFNLVIIWITAPLVWQVLTRLFPGVALLLMPVCLLLTFFLLWLRLSLVKTFWLKLWLFVAPWLLCSLLALPSVSPVPFLSIVFLAWMLLGFWGTIRFFPFSGIDSGLHTARFAHLDELSHLLAHTPAGDGLLLGIHRRHMLSVGPQQTRRELGNLLIVGPTRSGKGLLATSQLLSWQQSVIVNDIKGELFFSTAGYRSTLGPVFVIDPTGIGHCFDPLQGKETEDELFSAASQLLFEAQEGDGRIFTHRAIGMLTQLFAAARIEGIPSLPYVRHITRLGVASAAERLNDVSPELATQFLDVSFAHANLSDRFLLSAWGTLTARMRPLLTETVVRCFTHSDFHAASLLCSEKPVSVYLRWPERDLLALSPLVRLLWGSLIDELITTSDKQQGRGCQPVLLLIDEAGRTAIPTLADHATTVVGRGISLWIALQSLSQLETVYGKPRAQVLKDNMESQIYYRPTDLATARYLEERLGTYSAYAHSTTSREGAETSEGRSERPIALLTAQEILQLKDEEIIGFHRRLPPFRLTRMDWRAHAALSQRQRISAPPLAVLPQLAAIPAETEAGQPFRFPVGYIDPDRRKDAVCAETEEAQSEG